MPKIKELNNQKLREYLEAYTALIAVEPKNDLYQSKIEAIKKALKVRELTGYDLENKGLTQKLTGIFSFLKKKK